VNYRGTMVLLTAITTITRIDMNTTTYQLQGLHCNACVGRVTQALSPLADKVNVSLSPMQVEISGAKVDLAALQSAVAHSGKYVLQENMPQAQVFTAQPAIPFIANSVSGWVTYFPLLLILAFILSASVLVQLGQHAGHGMGLAAVGVGETMRYFMAGFFLVFAFFKLLDIRAFANAYAGYDLLAERWHGWGYVYPFVELGLGVAYLAHISPWLTHWVTIIVMGFSAIGVVRAVLSKTQIQCACLGTVFKLPMSTVTIVEDLGMVAMAALMLVLA
jgi:copper chaperone CopZ